MDKDKLNKPEELADEDLEVVTGGGGVEILRAGKMNGKYYIYNGPVTEEALTQAYTCPKCGHTIYWGADLWDWYTTCEGCGEKWWMRNHVNLNLSTGYWKEVSYEEYLWVGRGYKPGSMPTK